MTPKRPKGIAKTEGELKRSYAPPSSPEILEKERKASHSAAIKAGVRRASPDFCDCCESHGRKATVVDKRGSRNVVLCEEHFRIRQARLRLDGLDLVWGWQ